MEELLFTIVFWGIFVGGGTIFLIFCAVMGMKQYKRDVAKQKVCKTNNDMSSDDAAYNTVTVSATVVDQTCCVKGVGIKMPKAIQAFTVTFKMENGDIVSLNVPEEMYDGFDKGQTGILTIVDGQLYGFELTGDLIT